MHMPTRAARVRQRVARRLPARLVLRARVRREAAALARVPALRCDLGGLRDAGTVDAGRLLDAPGAAEGWRRVSAGLDALAIPERRGGLNLGDRRALVHLVHALGARSVLEIGTHIGASTLSLAAALADAGRGDASLVTVDVADVNDPRTRPWRVHGALRSPAEMVRDMGFAPFVEFVTAPSLEQLTTCTRRFDLVFLDGDHAAATVYREIPAALRLLNGGGAILLHDHFPGLAPLWPDVPVLPGPYLATRRLAAEGAPLAVAPLGPLPWADARGSRATSLALLLRATSSRRPGLA